MHAKQILLSILVLLCFCNLVTAQQIQKETEFTIGQTLQFKSAVLDETRILNVYLPATYQTNANRQYPVIYLLDGSAEEDFIHVVGIVQFGSFAWIKMLPESIVVGIANVDRKRDFTAPPKNELDKKDFPTSGGSARFIECIKKEIQPLIDKKYRTADGKTLIGQSLGGLLATEILHTDPGLFDNYVIVSPSLWWDDQTLLKSNQKPIPKGTSIFVGVGKEGETMEKLAEDLFHKLTKTNGSNTRVWFEHFPMQSHGDVLHLATYKAFEKLFAGYRNSKPSEK